MSTPLGQETTSAALSDAGSECGGCGGARRCSGCGIRHDPPTDASHAALHSALGWAGLLVRDAHSSYWAAGTIGQVLRDAPGRDDSPRWKSAALTASMLQVASMAEADGPPLFALAELATQLEKGPLPFRRLPDRPGIGAAEAPRNESSVSVIGSAWDRLNLSPLGNPDSSTSVNLGVRMSPCCCIPLSVTITQSRITWEDPTTGQPIDDPTKMPSGKFVMYRLHITFLFKWTVAEVAGGACKPELWEFTLKDNKEKDRKGKPMHTPFKWIRQFPADTDDAEIPLAVRFSEKMRDSMMFCEPGEAEMTDTPFGILIVGSEAPGNWSAWFQAACLKPGCPEDGETKSAYSYVMIDDPIHGLKHNKQYPRPGATSESGQPRPHEFWLAEPPPC
jgi:hypothetical protein